MRRLALPVTLALAVFSAGTLSAQERAGVTTLLPPAGPAPAGPSPAGPQPIIADVTPPHLPPIHNGEHGNGHNGHNGGHNGHAAHSEHEEHAEGRFFGFAELLIWRPRWQNQDYAIIDPRLDLGPVGTTQSLSFDGRAGLRVGLGYQVPDSAWAITFSYTYLRSEAENGLNAPLGGNLYPTFTRPGLIDTVTAARAESRLRYNVFDLDFSRDVCGHDCASLRFLAGVRLASIDYAMNAFYDGGDAIRAVAAMSSDFEGAGPTIGTQGTWKMGHGLGLFGRARTSLLYGDIHSRYRETDRNGAVITADVQHEVSRIVPTIDLGLGVSYEYRNFHAAIGYEVSHWFQIAEMPQFIDDFSPGKFVSRQSSLSLDGVFFRVGLAY